MTERTLDQCYYPKAAQWTGASHVAATIRGFPGDNITVFRVDIPRGFDEAMHAHPHEQMMYIVSGRVRITFPDEPPIWVGPDEFIHFPSNKPHAAYAEEDTVSIDVFAAPHRNEMLQPPKGSSQNPI